MIGSGFAALFFLAALSLFVCRCKKSKLNSQQKKAMSAEQDASPTSIPATTTTIDITEEKPHVTIRAEIVAAQTREDVQEGKYTVYEVKVTNLKTNEAGYVFRRYSEFYDLHAKLSAKFASFATDIVMPPTSWFFKLTDDVVQQRKVGLQEMLNKILCHSTYSEEADVIQFLNIRDTLMLEKAIAYYRSKMYHYKQLKHLSDEKQKEVETCRSTLKYVEAMLVSEKRHNMNGPTIVIEQQQHQQEE